MVLGAFRTWDEERKLLLAPRLYPFSRRNNYGKNFLKRWISRAGYYLLMPLLNRIYKLQGGASDELIDECDLPYYMAASDVIFIQRKDVLNSANIPLAFLFHKIAIGPNVGNIGELLKSTGNPTFSPDNKTDIVRALKEALTIICFWKGRNELHIRFGKYAYRQSGQAICQTLQRVDKQVVTLPLAAYQITENMENNKIKVSVVIPVYNTEKYVREAIESIIHQSLKELEIIIINDGSTDGSPEILKEISNTDHRIQVYTQTNQGQSTARNFGISHARGKYIYFMDSDDLLEEDALEACYLKCEEMQLDFVFFDAQSFYENNIKNAPSLNYRRTGKLEEKVYNGSEALKLQLQNKEYTPSPCLNLIRKGFLEKIYLQFYPGIVHEDQLFTTLLYLQATRTACIKRTFFQRRMRQNSIMTCQFAYRNIEGYLVVTQEMLKFKKQTAKNEEKEIIDLYLSQMLNAVMWASTFTPITGANQTCVVVYTQV